MTKKDGLTHLHFLKNEQKMTKKDGLTPLHFLKKKKKDGLIPFLFFEK